MHTCVCAHTHIQQSPHSVKLASLLPDGTWSRLRPLPSITHTLTKPWIRETRGKNGDPGLNLCTCTSGTHMSIIFQGGTGIKHRGTWETLSICIPVAQGVLRMPELLFLHLFHLF